MIREVSRGKPLLNSGVPAGLKNTLDIDHFARGLAFVDNYNQGIFKMQYLYCSLQVILLVQNHQKMTQKIEKIVFLHTES